MKKCILLVNLSIYIVTSTIILAMMATQILVIFLAIQK